MNREMTCAEARSQFWLLEYGELSFDEEERIETHLDGCAECRGARERDKEIHAGFDSLAVDPSASLLRECRAELEARLRLEPPPRATEPGWWEQFASALSARPVLRLVRAPVGALAMLALGFAAARLAPSVLNSHLFPGAVQAGMNRVRDVHPFSNGRIQILVDETRQRTVSGASGDPQIQALLLEAARDPADPGLREQSLDLLNKRAPSSEVRDTLVYALRHDDNAGVRLKAIEGLQGFAAEPEVRSALSQTLLSDSNPGVRMRAIDLLTGGEADLNSGIGPNLNLDRQVIGTLQELMQREDNAYLRQRSQRILEALNASTEIY
ncbi:MAG TPA: HEAT repeat domain-containing protein [Bryobacteraceae bacterium]